MATGRVGDRRAASRAAEGGHLRLGESYRPRVQAFIRKLAAVGQQIFIVCPLVGEADQIPDERKAVTAYARQLQEQVFPDLRVAVLHGRQRVQPAAATFNQMFARLEQSFEAETQFTADAPMSCGPPYP